MNNALRRKWSRVLLWSGGGSRDFGMTLKTLTAPATKDRGPRYSKQTRAAIHQADRRQSPSPEPSRRTDARAAFEGIAQGQLEIELNELESARIETFAVVGKQNQRGSLPDAPTTTPRDSVYSRGSDPPADPLF